MADPRDQWRALITTRSGLEFDLAAPDPAQVRLDDIAHALSLQCRFNGHGRAFYSVAQHAVLVADLVAVWAGAEERAEPAFSGDDPDDGQRVDGLSGAAEPTHQLRINKLARAALHHDDAEAYTGDLVSPLKAMMPAFVRIERRVHASIAVALDLPLYMPSVVKRLDRLAAALEAYSLFDPVPQWVWRGLATFPELVARVASDETRASDGAQLVPVTPCTAEEARERFLVRARMLDEERRTLLVPWSPACPPPLDLAPPTESSFAKAGPYPPDRPLGEPR